MKSKLLTPILLTLLVLTLIIPTITVTAKLQLSSSFKGEITKFEIPMKKPATPPGLDKLKAEIVFPQNGAILPPDTYTVKISVTSTSVITDVQLEITSVDTFEIADDFDGTYYIYEWVASEGIYTLTATVTDDTGKTTTDSIQVTIAIPDDPEPAPNKWAVVIGISDYSRGKSNDLWNADKDALDMVDVLKDNGYASSNIKLLLNTEATASNIVSAISWLVENEDADSEVVFFYSGHGARVADSQGWDSDEEDDGFDEVIVTHDLYGISDGQLAQLFSSVQFESQRFALMFGSCYSGGMNDILKPGRVIATACAEDQLGWDYLNLENTLWGYYFIDRGLLNPDNTAVTSVETAYVYAYPYVVAEQSDSQPQLYDSFDGDFIL